MLAVTTRDGVDLLGVARLEQPTGGSPLIVRLRDNSALPIYDVISRDDQLLFVSDERAHRISVFNLPSALNPQHRGDALVGHIPTARAPVGLAVSPDGKWLYATSEVAPRTPGFPDRCTPPMTGGSNQPVGVLFKIDIVKAAANPRSSIVAAIPAGCDPVRVAVSPSGKTLWVTARSDDALLRIPATDLKVGGGQIETDSFHIGTEPVGVAVRPDGKQVWVALSARFTSGESGGLAGVNGIGGDGKAELMSVPAKGFPRELNFLPDGRTLVVTLFRARAIEFLPTPQ
jgi:DNA-binding beta-propeller fold protein YncE